MVSRLVELQVIEVAARRLIGRRLQCRYGHPDGNPIGAFWAQCFQDGTAERLQAYDALRQPAPLFGWMGEFDDEARTFDYVISALTRPDAVPFEGAVARDVPALRYAVGTIEGPVPDLFMAAADLVRRELERRSLRINTTHRFEAEAYDHRFNHDAPTQLIEYWIPLEG